MDYALPIRYLARAFYQAPPSLTGSKTLLVVAKALGVEDLDVQPTQQLSLATGAVVARMSLSSPDQTWRVVGHGESIDVSYLPTLDEPHAVSLARFVETSKEILSVTADLSAPAHRLACTTEGLLRELSEAEMETISSRLISIPNTFQAPWEWDWRCVNTVVRRFADLEEPTNTIATVKRASGVLVSQEPFDRIRVDLDINTTPKNTEARFRGTDTTSFFDEWRVWYQQLSDSVSDLMGVKSENP